MLAVCDALTFGRSAGLDLAKVIAALEHGAGASWMLTNRGLQVSDRFWGLGFAVDLQQKHLDLVSGEDQSQPEGNGTYSQFLVGRPYGRAAELRDGRRWLH